MYPKAEVPAKKDLLGLYVECVTVGSEGEKNGLKQNENYKALCLKSNLQSGNDNVDTTLTHSWR